MAFDALVVSAAVSELNKRLLNGTVMKVAQPEREELLITFKVNREPVRVRLSADSQLPLVCIKEENALSPIDAPAFCMALRKHLQGGRLVSVTQGVEYERVVIFEIEHLDEMGDRGMKYLICELMGKHSNIILKKADGSIIDSIKHVPASTSSLREVLPGRQYYLPETGHKGLGKVMDAEILYRASLSGKDPETVKEELFKKVSKGGAEPQIVYYKGKPCEFSAVPLLSFKGEGYTVKEFGSVSETICAYYEEKSISERIKQRSQDLRQVLKILTERTAKKLSLQEKQYADTEKREQYRIYGELINTYGYSLKGGEKELRCENYYDEGREIVIPLDEHKSAFKNSKLYFDKYQKLKRTREALSAQIRENSDILYHLDSISNALLMCENEADLREIRTEMQEAGFLKKTGTRERIRKEEKKSEPLRFISSDGMEILVGRNNTQNEELTFKTASKDDWWFHAKKIPGSHVIVKTGKQPLPDKTCLEACALAAYYSKAGREREDSLIEVDYVKRGELKKVPGAPPGFVIYHTNYSIMIEPAKKI